MLFPLWIKEQPGYQKLCKWVFVGVNSVALAINLADAVYFPFTLRRTTMSVFQEFNNEHNLGSIVLHNALTHWYLVVAFVLLVAFMQRLYVMPRTTIATFPTPKSRWMYGLQQFICLAIATIGIVAGARGGLQSGVC